LRKVSPANVCGSGRARATGTGALQVAPPSVLRAAHTGSSPEPSRLPDSVSTQAAANAPGVRRSAATATPVTYGPTGRAPAGETATGGAPGRAHMIRWPPSGRLRTQQASSAPAASPASTGRSSAPPSAANAVAGPQVSRRSRSTNEGVRQVRSDTSDAPDSGCELTARWASPAASNATLGFAATSAETSPSASQKRPRSNETAVAMRLV
jgi:hypothetical protein